MFSKTDLNRIGRAVKFTEKVPALKGDESYRRGTTGNVKVKVTSSIGIGGKYQGVMVTGSATDLNLTGITVTTTTVLILNEPEEGSTVSQPMIQSTPICSGTIIGTDSASGYPIVMISCFTGQQCG